MKRTKHRYYYIVRLYSYLGLMLRRRVNTFSEVKKLIKDNPAEHYEVEKYSRDGKFLEMIENVERT